jgi:hypothetical protein
MKLYFLDFHNGKYSIHLIPLIFVRQTRRLLGKFKPEYYNLNKVFPPTAGLP